MPIRDKVVSADEAVAIIRSGDMVATSGFVGVGTPDAIFAALEKRFLADAEPRGWVSCLPRPPATARSAGSIVWPIGD